MLTTKKQKNNLTKTPNLGGKPIGGSASRVARLKCKSHFQMKRKEKKIEEKKPKRKTQKEILLENAEEVIEMVRAAKTYEDIQKKFSVCADTVLKFFAESVHSARVREAQKESAEIISQKAEKVLLELEKGCDTAEIARARELAHHYRWLAAKKNPQRFGDSTKIQAEVKDTSSTSSWLGEVLNEIDNNK